MNVVVTHVDFDNPEKITWTTHRDCVYNIIDARILKVSGNNSIKAGAIYAQGTWLKVEYI